MSLPPLRRIVPLLAAASFAALTAGCAADKKNADITGSIDGAKPASERSPAEWRKLAEAWRERYKANAADVNTALSYAAVLRGAGHAGEAVKVVEPLAPKYPDQPVVQGVYGRALAEAGRHQDAIVALGRAIRPDKPDWRVLNARGAVLDQLGRSAEARKDFEAALKLAPDEPAVLSNLGLSYAMTRELEKAEATLKRAAQNPRATAKVRQNLALVLGLRGKTEEAETVARQDLSGSDAASNLRYWKDGFSKTRQPG